MSSLHTTDPPLKHRTVRLLAVGAVLGMVLIAGCSGPQEVAPGGPAEPTAPDQPTPSATPTQTDTSATATDTVTPSRSPTPTPQRQYPPGYDETGLTNTTRARTAHTDTLVQTDGFAVAFNGTLLDANNTARTVRWYYAVDAADQTVYTKRAATASGQRTQYFENETVHVRETPPDGSTRYSSRRLNYTLAGFTGAGFLAAGIDDISFGPPDRMQHNGTVRYRYPGPEVADDAVPFGGDDPPLRQFQARLLVDADGVVREFAYEADVRTAEGWSRLRVSLGVVAINNTDIEEPDWTDRSG